MINKIIDGILNEINSEFGDAYEIYTETIEQGLKEPCFSVLCINPTNEQFFGKRYFRTNQFCIHYFPQSSEKLNESFEVLGRLYDSLEYITVDGDLVRGTEMKGEFTDGTLNFFVNYDMFVYKEEVEENMMEILNQKTDVKG